MKRGIKDEAERMVLDSTQISFTITNNTDSSIPMSIMGNTANLADISNQLVEYSWDVTAIIFSVYNTLTITFRNINNTGQFTTLTATVTTSTIQGFLDALNSLSISSFYQQTLLSNTYIKTYNDQTFFTDLYISSNSAIPSISFLTVNLIGSGGTYDILANAVSITSGSSPITITNQDLTGSFNNGDTVNIQGIASFLAANTDVKVTQTQLNTGVPTIIVNDTYIPGSPIASSYIFNGSDFRYDILIINN